MLLRVKHSKDEEGIISFSLFLLESEERISVNLMSRSIDDAIQEIEKQILQVNDGLKIAETNKRISVDQNLNYQTMIDKVTAHHFYGEKLLKILKAFKGHKDLPFFELEWNGSSLDLKGACNQNRDGVSLPKIGSIFTEISKILEIAVDEEKAATN